MKMLGVGLSLAVALLVVVAVSLAGAGPARAQQGGLAAPGNVRAADGDRPGAVTVSWDGVEDAAFYRIGWVASDRIAAVQGAGRDWLDAFAFADVANLGQTAHTLTELAPGARYAFSIGSLDGRFGAARWSEWGYLTLADVPATVCPIDGGGPTATPTATPSPTPMPTPTPLPTPTSTPTPRPTPIVTRDYDTDQDGLIEVSNLAQLAAINADLDGDGVSSEPAYAAAFPDAMPGMGCPDAGCAGYELVAHLDFDTNSSREADAGDAYWNDGAGWLPIGNWWDRFTADFDGNNHVIANLYIDRGDVDYVGLFGYVSDGHIKQLGLESATVSGDRRVGSLVGGGLNFQVSDSYATGSVSGNAAGGLVGLCYQCTISDSYAMSSVVAGREYSQAVGGLVGELSGTIIRSYATGRVSGSVHGNGIGGLVGAMSSCNISDSYATGRVVGNGAVGGLVGLTGLDGEGTISGSYATGKVVGKGSVGGLVGHITDINIKGSYATGNVDGLADVGGLVGSSGGTLITNLDTGNVYMDYNYKVGSRVGSTGGAISGSYATGIVLGGYYVGGLVGSNGGSISAAYAAGGVAGSGDVTGGLVGRNVGGEITASYWDTKATWRDDSYGGVGGVGKTTAELQAPTGYTGIYAEWNLDLDGDGDGDDPWDFGDSGQYPALKYGGLDVDGQRR